MDGSDPAMGAGVLRLHGGAKGGSDPASGVDPAIGSPCKHGIDDKCSNALNNMDLNKKCIHAPRLPCEISNLPD